MRSNKLGVLHESGLVTRRTGGIDRHGRPKPESYSEFISQTKKVDIMRSSLTLNPKDSDNYRRPSNYSVYVSSHQKPLKYHLSGSVKTFSIHGDMSETTMGGSAGGYFTPFDTGPIDYNMQQELRAKVLVNLRDEVFDLSMVLAELDSTASTGAQLLGTIGRSLQAVARRKPKHYAYLLRGTVPKGRNTDVFLRESAGVFLQWKYGIMPTVYDLQGVCATMDMNRDGSLWDNPPLLVARASVKRTTYETVQFIAEQIPGPRPELLVETERTAKARIDYIVSGEGLRGLNRYGIGLGTVATIAWDKTPFSFVLDMVFPMATMLKAWSALGGVNVKGSTETYMIKHKVRGGVHTLPYQNDSRRYRWDDYESPLLFQRIGGTSANFPLPYIKNPIRVGNLQTALALFTQLRRKG